MIKAIIFDLGGVLIDWNPRHLYRKLFNSEQEIEDFLANITTMDWNEEQDMGRPLKEGTEWLVSQHPQHEAYIRAYYDRWEEMLGGPLADTVELFKQLKDSGKYKLYALTNWSAETMGIALKRYDFLNWFDGMVISGKENTRKPFAEFYKILLNRYELKPGEALFIDDNQRNVSAAEDVGIPSIHFTGADALIEALQHKDIL